MYGCAFVLRACLLCYVCMSNFKGHFYTFDFYAVWRDVNRVSAECGAMRFLLVSIGKYLSNSRGKLALSGFGQYRRTVVPNPHQCKRRRKKVPHFGTQHSLWVKRGRRLLGFRGWTSRDGCGGLPSG